MLWHSALLVSERPKEEKDMLSHPRKIHTHTHTKLKKVIKKAEGDMNIQSK